MKGSASWWGPYLNRVAVLIKTFNRTRRIVYLITVQRKMSGRCFLLNVPLYYTSAPALLSHIMSSICEACTVHAWIKAVVIVLIYIF